MNTKRLLIAYVCIFFSITSQSQVWNWAKKLPGPDNGGLHGMASVIDVQGNYVVLTGTDTLWGVDGNYSLNNQFFVNKYDNQGILLWSKNFSAPQRTWAIDLAADSAGSIYILSEKYTQVDGVPYNGPAGISYLTKLTAMGDLRWVKPLGEMGNYNKRNIKADGKNVYVYGTTINNNTFQYIDTTLTAPAPPSGGFANFLFLGKIDSAGVRQWQKVIIDTLGYCGSLSMDINNKNQLAFSGSFNKKIWLNGNQLTNPQPFGTADFYAAINTNNGQYINVIPVAQPQYHLSQAITISDSSKITFAQGFGDTIVRVWQLPAGNFNLLYLPGTYLMTYDLSNNLQSVKKISNAVPYILYDLESDATNNVYGGLKLFVNNGLFNDSAYLAVVKYNVAKDTARNITWQANIAGNYYQQSIWGYAVMPSLDVRNNEISVTGGYRQTGNFGPYTVAANNFVKGFIASLKEGACTIGGKVYIDLNTNGQFDSGEMPVTNKVITTQNNYFDYTDINGDYKIYTDTGSYTVQLQTPVTYYNSVPATQTANFNAYGQTATNKNFAQQAAGTFNDLEIDVTPMTFARPGRVLTYLMTLKNKGTTTLTNKYSLKLGTYLTYAGSDSTATVIGDSVTWNYTTLKPFETRTNHVNCNVSTSAVIASVVKSIGYAFPVAGDATPDNNVDTAYSIITAGYDPNDKIVFPGNQVHIDSVQQGKQFLEYIIRFQNTGNDTAFQIRVVDSMTTKLNPATFELISSSHPVEINRKGQRTFEFSFPNILLPDSIHNEPKSHGFVKFRVKPVTTVVLTDSVYNFADIFFDYNAPVRTNTIATGFRNTVVTGVNDPTLNTTDLKIFPNPASVQLIYKLEKSPRETMMARVYDITGRIIVSSELKGNGNTLSGQFAINGLPVGVYQLEIISSKTRYVREFLVRAR